MQKPHSFSCSRVINYPRPDSTAPQFHSSTNSNWHWEYNSHNHWESYKSLTMWATRLQAPVSTAPQFHRSTLALRRQLLWSLGKLQIIDQVNHQTYAPVSTVPQFYKPALAMRRQPSYSFEKLAKLSSSGCLHLLISQKKLKAFFWFIFPKSCPLLAWYHQEWGQLTLGLFQQLYGTIRN